jgi:hypothetical protein
MKSPNRFPFRRSVGLSFYFNAYSLMKVGRKVNTHNKNRGMLNLIFILINQNVREVIHVLKVLIYIFIKKLYSTVSANTEPRI